MYTSVLALSKICDNSIRVCNSHLNFKCFLNKSSLAIPFKHKIFTVAGATVHNNIGIYGNASQPSSMWTSNNVTCYRHQFYGYKCTTSREFYTSNVHLNSENPKVDNKVVSAKDKLKRAIAEYGSTVIIFHVSISLVSLGIFYALVSSGVDIGKLLNYIGVTGNIATNAGTFVTAYAVHKIFAPVRISITLGATPFIVRYLRRVGILKKPA